MRRRESPNRAEDEGGEEDEETAVADSDAEGDDEEAEKDGSQGPDSTCAKRAATEMDRAKGSDRSEGEGSW
jgi:hypothetical protein